jgi:hypothetical protein
MTPGSTGWSPHRRLLLRSATISLILAIPFLILRPDHYENGVKRPSLSLPGLFPSTWDTSSSCPDPYHDDLLPIDRELHSGSQTCYPASSATPAFDVEICASGRTCNAFSVRIRRTDSTRMSEDGRVACACFYGGEAGLAQKRKRAGFFYAQDERGSAMGKRDLGI